MTLTKAAMADNLFLKMGLNKVEAREVVEAFFAGISEALVAGNDVKLSGFGNFRLLDKGPRPGRNPKTGEDVTISARRVVAFRAGNKLRHRVDAAHAAVAAADDD